MLRSATLLALVGAAAAKSENPFAEIARSAVAGIPGRSPAGRSPAGRSLLAVEANACAYMANNMECGSAETVAECDALTNCAYDATNDSCDSTADFTEAEVLAITGETIFEEYLADYTECEAASTEAACDDILKCDSDNGTCDIDSLYTSIYWSNECDEVAEFFAAALPGNLTMSDINEAAAEVGIEVDPTLENALAAEGMEGATSNAVTFSAALVTTVAAAVLTMA